MKTLIETLLLLVLLCAAAVAADDAAPQAPQLGRPAPAFRLQDQNGTWHTLDQYSYARRDTFLIDPNGNLAKHYQDVDPKQNVKQVLADLAALQAAAH